MSASINAKIAFRYIPVRIYLLAAFFLFLPVAGYWLTAARYGIPAHKIPLVLARYSVLTLVLYAACWTIAYGLLMVKKWTYYLTIAFLSSLMLFNIFYLAYLVLKAQADARTVPDYTYFAINTTSIVVFAAIILFLVQYEISVPFLSNSIRAWRSKSRHLVPVLIKLIVIGEEETAELSGETENISLTGCFVFVDGETKLRASQKIGVDLYFGKVKILVVGVVVRTVQIDSRTGVGIRFRFHRSSALKARLKRILKKYDADLPIEEESV